MSTLVVYPLQRVISLQPLSKLNQTFPLLQSGGLLKAVQIPRAVTVNNISGATRKSSERGEQTKQAFATSWFRTSVWRSGFRFISHQCRESRLDGSQSTQVATEDGVLTDIKLCDYEPWGRGGGMVHAEAKIDASVIVEVGAVVQANAQIGPHVHISSGSVVGSDVIIGSHSKLGFNVSLQNCSVGESCTLHNGVTVGQDGFGFTVNEEGEVVKKPQLLKVQIGQHVEIGANTCIDRGSWRDTIVGDHTKIDNLVQIGHNVVIGRCCMLCGQAGLAGSSTLGDYVVMGGKASVTDHVSIVSKVRIGALSGVMSHITKPGDYAGFPAVPLREWKRQMIALRKLGRKDAKGAV